MSYHMMYYKTNHIASYNVICVICSYYIDYSFSMKTSFAFHLCCQLKGAKDVLTAPPFFVLIENDFKCSVSVQISDSSFIVDSTL